jgi:DNA-binding NarL/FixJ family response regulator
MEPSRQPDPPPSPIINSLSVRNPMISIGVVDEHSFTRECITRSLKEFDDSLDIMSFITCDDCLRIFRDLDLILYHVHQSIAHNLSNDGRIATLKQLQEIAPVIILSGVDSPDSVLEALESGARGYIPTASTSLELAIGIIRLVRAGGTFVPPSSLPVQRIKGTAVTSKGTTEEQFTPRQMAVLDHLKLGKANKVIAYELAMSESTVKVHIRNIMKKMKATNRTEVACRAQALATFGAT